MLFVDSSPPGVASGMKFSSPAARLESVMGRVPFINIDFQNGCFVLASKGQSLKVEIFRIKVAKLNSNIGSSCVDGCYKSAIWTTFHPADQKT